jgi:RND family efflux transporter MFP subunit
MNEVDRTIRAPESLPAATVKPKFTQRLLSGLPTILVLSTMAVGWMVMHYLNSHDSASEEAATEAPTASETLKMPDGKLQAGNFESLPAQSRTLQHFHTVPGRLRYDQTKHVTVKAPIDGILSELRVAPGDHVAAGDLIAIIHSPEVGQARAAILKSQQELDLAQQIWQREQMLAKKLKQLSNLLDQGQSPTQIEAVITDFAHGIYQQEILSAYFRVRLAEENLLKVKPLVDDGAVAGRLVREREVERQLAEVAFRTARDQAGFAIAQANQIAAAKVAEAERQLTLAWQTLETLLGYQPDASAVTFDNQASLSRLEVRAPIEGSVESREFANNERVMRGDPLLVLANTDSLSVEASIRDSDWSAVGLASGAEVLVMVPALGDRQLSAQVRYFGREVQSDTNAIPLVAQIDNSDGLLRPGMFVRVAIPVGPPRQALSIKPESILLHENQEFVFLDLSEGVFRKVNVTTGQAADDWIEITAGLAPGQRVVTNGTFLLKSELLLQGEGD